MGGEFERLGQNIAIKTKDLKPFVFGPGQDYSVYQVDLSPDKNFKDFPVNFDFRFSLQLLDNQGAGGVCLRFLDNKICPGGAFKTLL